MAKEKGIMKEEVRENERKGRGAGRKEMEEWWKEYAIEERGREM